MVAKLKSACERKGEQWRNDLRVNPHGRPQSHREIAATLAESGVLGNMNPRQFTEQVNNHLISQARKSIWGTEHTQLRLVSNKFGRQEPLETRFPV